MGYVIYKIVCDDVPEYIYIGSTKNFTNRKSSHKVSCNNENSKKYNAKKYTKIRENGGWDNWRMVIIHECEEGITKTQAEMIEEKYRIELQANLNSQSCCGLNEEQRKEQKKEYYQNNKDTMKEQNKEYRKNNKDKINEKQKEYRAKNKEKNKEKNREYDKAYREKNKERIRLIQERYKNNKKNKLIN